MNNKRRKAIRSIAEKIDELRSELEQLRDEEQDAYDNLPEGIQCSERGEAMDTIIYNLDDVLESLVSAYDGLDELEAG